MCNVSISQFQLRHPDGHIDKLAIITCDSCVTNPKTILDNIVSNYVDHELYNEFIDINTDNPWMRVIVRGINELNYNSNIIPSYGDVQVCEYVLSNTLSPNSGQLSILRGGLHSETPIAYMNSAVTAYTNRRLHNQFIEIFKDNPWVRLIIFDINNLRYEPYINQKIYDTI